MNNVLSAAIDLARLGHPVIPLHEASKKPAISRWQVKASTCPKQLERWFADHPGRNLGLCTGGQKIAIDIDPARGGAESLAKAIGKRKMPVTAKAITGGGGFHLGFTTPFPVGNHVDVLPGIDIRGTGGQIVVEPSVHPITGREYVWIVPPSFGFAPCPNSILRLIPGFADHKPVSRVRPDATRKGDAEVLASDLVARFVVSMVGQRSNQMARAVGSMVGRGFDDDLTVDAVSSWWNHYYRLGVIRTNPAEANREIRATIRSARVNPNFVVAIGRDHQSLRLEIELTDDQRRIINTDTRTLQVQRERLEHTNNTGVTLTSGRLSDRLCVSGDESAFVEALVVFAIYGLQSNPTSLLKMTRDQIRGLASSRYQSINWDNKQYERLKAKYISRPDQPATRFEMLSEVVKGDRKPGVAIGTPSEYLPTGIMLFFVSA